MKKLIFILNVIVMTCSFLVSKVMAQCNTIYDWNTWGTGQFWNIVDPVTTGNGSISKFPGFFPSFNGYMQFSSADGASCASQIGACNGRDLRAWQSLPGLLNNSSWRADIDFKVIHGNGPSHILLGLTAGNQNFQGQWNNCPNWVCGGTNNSCGGFTNSNQDGIFASLVAFGNDQVPSNYSSDVFPGSGSGWRIYGHAKNDNQSMSGCANFTFPCLNWSEGILLPSLNTWYYLRLERLTPTECKISIFSNSARTTHVPGSPQCFTIEAGIVDLDTKQMGVWNSGSYYRSLTADLDNLGIWNNCGMNPDFTLTGIIPSGNTTIYEVAATPAVSNADISAMGGGYWWQVEEVDANGAVIGSVMSNPSNWWDSQATNYFPGYCCNTGIYNPTKGTFYQGHYYRISRAVWGTCAAWTGISKTIYMNSGRRPENPIIEIIKENVLSEPPSYMTAVMNPGKMENIKIYPNPSEGLIKIDMTGVPGFQYAGIEIYDLMGKPVRSATVNEQKTEIDMSAFPKGIYLVKIYSNNEVVTRKIQLQ